MAYLKIPYNNADTSKFAVMVSNESGIIVNADIHLAHCSEIDNHLELFNYNTRSCNYNLHIGNNNAINNGTFKSKIVYDPSMIANTLTWKRTNVNNQYLSVYSNSLASDTFTNGDSLWIKCQFRLTGTITSHIGMIAFGTDYILPDSAKTYNNDVIQMIIPITFVADENSFVRIRLQGGTLGDEIKISNVFFIVAYDEQTVRSQTWNYTPMDGKFTRQTGNSFHNLSDNDTKIPITRSLIGSTTNSIGANAQFNLTIPPAGIGYNWKICYTNRVK